MTRRGRPVQAAPHRIPFHRDRLPGGYPESVADGADGVAGATHCAPAPTLVQRARPSSTSRYGAAALADEVDQVERAPESFRTNTLFKAAAAVGELVEGGELDKIAAEAHLKAAGRLVGLSQADVRRTVARGLERGKRRPRRAPDTGPHLGTADKVQLIAELSAWWERTSAAEWPGLAGSSRLRVLAGLFLLALGAGKVTLAESLRQVSEACGLSHATVWRHRAALAPWAVLVSRGDRRTGTRHQWRLRLGASPRAQGETSPQTRRGGALHRSGSGLFHSARLPVAGTLTDPTHDVWGRWSGGWRLFCLLSEEERVTARELAEATGYAVGTIRRSLARLADMGLAERDGDLAWRLIPEAVPRAEDVGEWAERRRRRHCDQRELYRQYRAHRLAAWEAARERQAVPGNEEVPPPADPETGEVASLSTPPVAQPPPGIDPETGEITETAWSPQSGHSRGNDMVTWPPDTGPELPRPRRRRTGNPTAPPASDGAPGERGSTP